MNEEVHFCLNAVGGLNPPVSPIFCEIFAEVKNHGLFIQAGVGKGVFQVFTFPHNPQYAERKVTIPLLFGCEFVPFDRAEILVTDPDLLEFSEVH